MSAPGGTEPSRLGALRAGILLALLMVACAECGQAQPFPAKERTEQASWVRHTVDNTSRGADGVRLGDVNGDGFPDIVTGWEEGGVVRVYLHPGYGKVRQAWPAVTVGRVASPEDAVFMDLDGDGNFDVISSTEGKSRQVYVHWGPSRERLLDPTAWRSESLPAAAGTMQWMFALPHPIDGQAGWDFFAGGKNENAAVGWFQAPRNPRRLADWRWHPLRKVGWLMTLLAVDMDGDGHEDLLLSDRQGDRRGVVWLKNPGPSQAAAPWTEHAVGNLGQDEVMFLAYGDLDGDGLGDIVAAVKPQQLHYHRRLDAQGAFAPPEWIPLPPEAGTAKAVAMADLDRDGLLDLVVSCEQAVGEKAGVLGLRAQRTSNGLRFQPFPISGPAGVKFDLVQLLDLDGDGDLDVLTCEETENLGVIWYENPGRTASAGDGNARRP